jgi:glycosyltransferase involved in cell wall biosynthesis
VQQCRERGLEVELLLAGLPDDNPTSFSAAQLQEWSKLQGISWLGLVSNIGELWAKAHIAVLPCRVREGVPKTLLDAAACGRPMIASDLAGVRVIARQNETALLVPPDNLSALTEALAQLATDAALRARLGVNARALVEGEMSARAIQSRAEAVYRGLRN